MLHPTPPSHTHSQSKPVTVMSVKSKESDFPPRVHVSEEDKICRWEWGRQSLAKTESGGRR